MHSSIHEAVYTFSWTLMLFQLGGCNTLHHSHKKSLNQSANDRIAYREGLADVLLSKTPEELCMAKNKKKIVVWELYGSMTQCIDFKDSELKSLKVMMENRERQFKERPDESLSNKETLPPPQSPQARLKELKELFENELISEDEYKEKRKQILENL